MSKLKECIVRENASGKWNVWIDGEMMATEYKKASSAHKAMAKYYSGQGN